jgi:NAD+ synthase
MGASYPELEWAMSVYNTHKADDFSGEKKKFFRFTINCTEQLCIK